MPRKEMITLEAVRTLKVMKAGSPILLPRAMRILQGFKQTYVQRVYIKFHRSKTRQGTKENDLWNCELVQAKDSV